MSEICIIGAGYVGLATAACLAEFGNDVACVDIDETKLLQLKAGAVPFYEPGLSEMISRNVTGGRLHFTSRTEDAVRKSTVVFIAVGTPQGEDGHADLTQVRAAAMNIARALNGPKVVVNKSTSPVETGDLIASIIREHRAEPYEVSVVSNPEFFREGSAIADFMHPERIIIGVSDKDSAEVMRDLYSPISAPLLVTDVKTAEMIKYAANAFLAMKISFANEIARICHEVGAEFKDVIVGVGSDTRIGPEFLNAGLGFGGSCFPKDVMALRRVSEKHGLEPALLGAILDVNETQIEWSLDRIKEGLGNLKGARVGVLGLALKPDTDDVRESPAIALIERLLDEGATVSAHDPVAAQSAQKILGERITYGATTEDVARGADALVLATDWNEYKQLDLGHLRLLMKGRVLFDGRNVYDPHKALAAGFAYIGVGRLAAGTFSKVANE